MKITVNKTVEEEIELPIYLEYLGWYCKILDEKKILKVYPVNYNSDFVHPFIDIIGIGVLSNYPEKINPITKERFDLEFLKTEKILNDLRKL